MTAVYTLHADGEVEQFDDLDEAIRAGYSHPVDSFQIYDADNRMVWSS